MAADGDLRCTLVFESNDLVRYEDTYKRQATATIDRGGLPWRTIAVLANWVRDHDDVVGRAELEVLGSHLYGLLFAGDVGKEFETSHDAFRSAGFGGRVRIELCFYPDAEELAKLPWEFLYSPGRPRGFFLAGEDRRLVLTRLVPKELSAPPVEAAKHPLRVLVVTCHGVAETGSYVQQIKSAIGSLIRPGDIELTPLDDPTFDELCDAVDDEERGRPDVLHLIAHGKPAGLMMKRTVDPDAARAYSAFQRAGESVAALADEVLVDARTVKGAFENHQPHLVLLHACDGDAPAWNSASADAPPLTRLFTTAREIAYAGVPAVVAMQYRISVDHALIFVKEFYGALARGASVGDAAKNGRKKLARDSKAPGVLEEFATRLFGAPVVYVQQDAPLIAAQETPRPSMPALPNALPRPSSPPRSPARAARYASPEGQGQTPQRLRRCAVCGTGNSAANKFCRKCGSSLRVCSCGHVYEDPQLDEICGECGESLWLDDSAGRDQFVALGGQADGQVTDDLRRTATI